MFTRGLLLRLGRQTKSNWGLDYKILHVILNNFESELLDDETSLSKKREIIMLGSFFLTGFVCALRGNEVFLVEAEGLQGMINRGRQEENPMHEHIIIPLLGRFKNEDGERWHVMLSVGVTNSKFEVRKWLERLVDILVAERRGMGPAFCDERGEMLNNNWVDERFVEEVKKVQVSHPNLIDQSIDVSEHYSIFRSLRKGSTARAVDTEVSATVIDLHNR